MDNKNAIKRHHLTDLRKFQIEEKSRLYPTEVHNLVAASLSITSRRIF